MISRAQQIKVKIQGLPTMSSLTSFCGNEKRETSKRVKNEETNGKDEGRARKLTAASTLAGPSRLGTSCERRLMTLMSCRDE